MSTLAVQQIQPNGTTLTLAAASGGGDSFPCGDNVFLLVKNGDSASHSITLITPGTERGLAVADRTIAVAAGVQCLIPVGDEYKVAATGLGSATYSAVTSVTVGAFSI